MKPTTLLVDVRALASGTAKAADAERTLRALLAGLPEVARQITAERIFVLGCEGWDARQPPSAGALPIVFLTAPARRDAEQPALEARRLSALANRVGAHLLVVIDGSPALLSACGGAAVNVPLSQATDPASLIAQIRSSAVPSAAATSASASAATSVQLNPQQAAAVDAAAVRALVEQRRPGQTSTVATAAATSRNVLVFVHAPRSHYREHIVSSNEIVCGPAVETRFREGRLVSLTVPAGSFDITPIVNWLPADQKPELVVVKADASEYLLPRNLGQLSCPKVLLVGDTHHLDAPLRKMIRYARQEPFMALVMDHTRQHGHFFVDAGFDRVGWIPSFDLSPHEPAWQDQVAAIVTFVGQTAYHPHRRHLIDQLTAAGVPLRVLQAPPADAARLYAESLVSLNASLNGDLNLRVLEVLAAGGLLLTDRLAPEAGLDLLLTDGKDAVLYDNPSDLVEKARHLLTHPAEARRIAREGRALYLREHTPAHKVKTLCDWIDGGKLDPRWALTADRRATVVRATSMPDLQLRLLAYEAVQELHRREPGVRLLVWPDVDPRLVADLADLPRLAMTVKTAETELDGPASRLWRDAGVWCRLQFAADQQVAAGDAPFDACLISANALLNTDAKALATLARGRRLLVAVRHEAELRAVVEREAMLATEGYLLQDNAIPVFEQKNPVVLGEIAAAEGRLEEAFELFQRAWAADPEYVDAVNNLGVLAEQAGDAEAAEAMFTEAVRLDRAHVPSLVNLALLRKAIGDDRDAEDLLSAATRADGAGADVWQHLADLRYARGDVAGALHATSQLALIDPGAAGVDEALAALRAERASSPRPAPDASSKATDPRVTARPLRILVISNLFPPQDLGDGRLMADFATSLAERGHVVQVLTSDTPSHGVVRELESGVVRGLTLSASWRNGRAELLPPAQAADHAERNLKAIAAMAASFRPDVALVGDIQFIAPNPFAPNLFAPLVEQGIPTVHYVTTDRPRFAPAEAPQSPLFSMVACSAWLAQRLRDSGYPVAERGTVYPGTLVDTYQMPRPPRRNRLRILYAGPVAAAQGAHVLVAALEELAGRGVSFSCTIAGDATDPAFVAELGQRLRARQLTRHVSLMGPLDRPRFRAVLARSNVLVFPAVADEPFGISQVEAMAAGCTVVTSGTGGASEIVENETSGLVFHSEDSLSLADALASLPADAERWERLSETGRARAFERFDMRRLAVDLENELTAFVERAPAPAPSSKPSKSALRVLATSET